MKKDGSFKNFSLASHLHESLVWIIPVGLILTTFILLFFGISEQVGRLRLSNLYMYNELNSLKAKLGADTATKDLPGNPENAAFTKKIADVSDLSVGLQKVMITDSDYWGYKFTSSKKLSEVTYSSVSEGTRNLLVISYKLGDSSTKAFELFPFSSGGEVKQITYNKENYTDVVIFYDGKLLLFNDFGKQESSNLKKWLGTLSSNKNISKEISEASSKELSSL